MAEYHFNSLNPTSFQRLVNAVLAARFGERLQIMPLRGKDGGRDATAQVEADSSSTFGGSVTAGSDVSERMRPGRYIFQVKFHRTLDAPGSAVRQAVLADLTNELTRNILPLPIADRPNHFILITNVPASKEAQAALSEKVTSLSESLPNLSIAVWWQDDLNARLDQFPTIWPSFPELFAGNIVPFLGQVIGSEEAVPKTFRMALATEFERDAYVRFRQIELRNTLSSLFVDVPLDQTPSVTYHDAYVIQWSAKGRGQLHRRSALQLIIGEEHSPMRILLEGAPGQGKSTVTQMASQIMRAALLGTPGLNPEGRWRLPSVIRLPFRVELRALADWLSTDADRNVEGFLARMISQDSGGRAVTVEDLHSAMQRTPTLCLFDGLDEIGTNEQRDRALQGIADFLARAETGLQTDIKAIVTTRPPAIAGRRDLLPGFISFPIGALSDSKISEYLERWLKFQCQDEGERSAVYRSFESRRAEPHVAALSRNPMQLSVLLHFIGMKSEAFPDKRAELYREYFKTVIDRDVEKSARLRQHRESIEILHQLIGFKLHISSETGASGATLSRAALLNIAREWLRDQETDKISAEDLFAVGEERLGLIIAVRGEGETTEYGYEIQPIREYFAAAFLNEQIQGDAHDVFTSLVRRSFWHEVAVFLAGLRRPNERADLLSRARSLDRDEALGWREDGRRIVLQLLLEGVFVQPGYVYTDGVAFALSAVDPREPAARYWFKDLVSALIRLCKAGDVERHQRQIREMLNYGRQAGDEYSSFRLLAVASGILTSLEFQQVVSDYNVPSLDLLGKVRLLWPCRWRASSPSTSGTQAFWRDETGKTWAKSAWAAALQCSSITSLDYPVAYHRRLIEQFAFKGTGAPRARPKLHLLAPESAWAIWWLALHHQMIGYALSAGARAKDEIRQVNLDITWSLEGLTPDLADVLVRLAEASRDGVRDALLAKPGSNGLQTYIILLSDVISKPGLASWIACRAVSMLAVSRSDRRRSTILREIPEWEPLLEKTAVMFDGAHRRNWPADLPSAVVQESGAITPVSDMFRGLWSGEHQTDCECWLHSIPVKASVIPTLIREAENLSATLSGIANHRVWRAAIRHPLPVQQIQRILATARRTNSDAVLAGAFSSLLESHFLKLAGAELTSRLIRAAVAFGDEAAVLFSVDRGSPFWDSGDMALIREIAADIVRDPHLYSGNTGAAAANFLYEHRPLEMSPLASDEAALGLYPQRRVDSER